MECHPKLQDILSEQQLDHILRNIAKPGAKIISYDLKSATTGISGFLADHFRLSLHVKEDSVKDIHLFVKIVPLNNQLKIDHIKRNNFNKREALIYKLFEEMDSNKSDSKSWRPQVYIYTDDILVMPDLAVEGYKSYPGTKYFDKNHIMVASASLARFHAAFANYATKKTDNESIPYDFLAEYGNIMTDTIFHDPRWSRTAGKLLHDFLKEFSTKFNTYPAYLEEQLSDLFIKANTDVKEYKDTLNVIVHKDLWFNNILFHYSGDVATNAVLLDYQFTLYSPPTFDVMQLLYFTTSRSFRDSHEDEVLRHYYSVFSESLDDDTKRRMIALNYDFNKFLNWCETARLFGLVYTAGAFSFILMDPVRAQKTFDNPETFMDLLTVDRSAPVIEHARENNIYRQKLLDSFEEVVEKYVVFD